jgi:hypothetical protein
MACQVHFSLTTDKKPQIWLARTGARFAAAAHGVR